MSRKAYTNRKKVIQKLQQYIMDLRSQGVSFLPSERTLCERFDCSRVILRKVLEEFEIQGQLIKGEKGRIIAEAESTFRVTYVTAGVEAIANYTWNHLWHELTKLSSKVGFTLELALFDNNLPQKTAELLQSKPDAIIFTCNLPQQVADTFPDIKDIVPIIAVDGHYLNDMDYAVVLDDYKVGYKAAETLLKSGCKSPVFIGSYRDPVYQPFADRQAGFTAALSDNGLSVGNHQFILLKENNPLEFHQQVSATVEALISNHNDGIFLFSDEHIDYIYQSLAEHFSIPDDLRLVTLNGSGRSLSHTPPVTAISHMVPEIAEILSQLIGQLAYNIIPKKKKYKIKPSTLFKGQTCRGDSL